MEVVGGYCRAAKIRNRQRVVDVQRARLFGSVQPAEIRIFMHLEGYSGTASWTKVPSGSNSNFFAPST